MGRSQMKVAYVGLGSQEAAALAFLVEREFKGICIPLSKPESGDGVEADVWVMDLLALGLPHHTPAGQAQLDRWLRQRPAVALVPSSDTSWAAAWAQPVGFARPIVALRKPYGAEAMRAALARAMSLAATDAVPSRSIESHPAPIRPAVPQPTAAASASTAALLPADEASSVSEARRRLEAAASEPGRALLSRMADAIGAGSAFEVHFTAQHMVVVDPGAAWVASNTPMNVVKRVSRSDALASVVSLRTIDSTQAEARVRQLRLDLMPLEDFVGALLASPEARPQRADQGAAA
jgi:hypothetical protein